MKNKDKKNSLWDVFLAFFKIGLCTFGGGYAMVSVIERDLVNNKKWITAEDMMNMLVIAESTPGVIAINSATFVGYKRAGVLGGIVATLGAVMPSFLIISVLSYFILAVQNNIWINAAFRGIRCAVVILIINAVIKLSKPIKKTWLTVLCIVIAFVLSTFLEINAIYIILGSGLLGIIYYGIKYRKMKEVPTETANQDEKKEEE